MIDSDSIFTKNKSIKVESIDSPNLKNTKGRRGIEIHAINRWGLDFIANDMDIPLGSLNRSKKALAPFTRFTDCKPDSICIYFTERKNDLSNEFNYYLDSLEIDTSSKECIKRILVREIISNLFIDSFFIDNGSRMVYKGKNYKISKRNLSKLLLDCPTIIKRTWMDPPAL